MLTDDRLLKRFNDISDYRNGEYNWEVRRNKIPRALKSRSRLYLRIRDLND